MRTLPPVLPAGDSTAMSFNLEQSSLISLRGYSERFPSASGLLFRPAGHRRDARVLSETVSICFADVSLAAAFVARWGAGTKVETAGRRLPGARG